MNIELHCHTRRSFDAFTTEQELLNACITNGIGVIAITEHDRMAVYDEALFQKNNIKVIPGCEFTSDLGAHIIGLYVKKPIKKWSTALEIINQIRDEDGLILIPHPFKTSTGVCALYDDFSDILDAAHMIELYNGGQNNTEEQMSAIKRLAKSYSLQMIAASDAHKPDQIGYYVTNVEDNVNIELRDTLTSGVLGMSINTVHGHRPRSLNKIQTKPFYQKIVKAIPYTVKRYIKLFYYQIKNKNYNSVQAKYKKIEI